MKNLLRSCEFALVAFLFFSSVSAMQNGDSYGKKVEQKAKKVFFISECLINQNIRAYGVQNIEGDGPVVPILELLMKNGMGISVVDCPEIEFEGLKRRACGKLHYEENGRYRMQCRERAIRLASRIAMYLADGYKIGGFICVNGSPSCAKDFCFLGKGQGRCQEAGVFIEEVKKEIEYRRLSLRLIGYDKWNLKSCLNQIQDSIDHMKE